MTRVVYNCGTSLSLPDAIRLSAVPTRLELKALDALAATALPTDPTPSLDEIAAAPDVRHLGAPAIAPQAPFLSEPLRVVVVGSDAALGAVLTRMMRGDYLWTEVGFVPASPEGQPLERESTAARNWGLPTNIESALALALDAPPRPVPLIRNDAGLALAGSATISEWSNGEITGEIIVDDTALVHHSATSTTGIGTYGARLVPMLDAPGILAARAISPVAARHIFSLEDTTLRRGLLTRLRKPAAPGQLDTERILTGRAVQAGGPALRVCVDGVSAKRPVQRVTFYRHLRDLQIARP